MILQDTQHEVRQLMVHILMGVVAGIASTLLPA